MENKMLTQDVVREISTRLDCYGKDVRDVINCFADVVAERVRQGESVHYAGLGTFYACRSRSPKPDAGTTIKFRAAKPGKRGNTNETDKIEEISAVGNAGHPQSCHYWGSGGNIVWGQHRVK